MKHSGKKADAAAAKSFAIEFPDEYAPLESQYIKNPVSPDAAAPETSAAPEAAVPETGVSGASAPVTGVPETGVPKTNAPETAAPEVPFPKASASPDAAASPASAYADLLGSQPSSPAREKASKKEKKARKRAARKEAKAQRKKRKGRFITPLIILSVILAIVAGCVLDVFYCKSHFEVNFYQVESMHVSADVRIAVISDVHLREYGEDNADLVSAVKALHPDLIISAGDLVTYGEENYDNMLSLCRQLAEIAPFYGVMGNHEDEKTYLEMDEEMRESFAATGMKLLINSGEKIRINNNTIELIGVSGGVEGFDLYGGKDYMDSLPENNGALRICVAHVPILFKERLENYDFDLGIAGHTHGGLVRLPVLDGLYSAEEGFLPDLDAGLFTLENNATLFISRGLGDSSDFPPRFNNTPELAVIDVRWY